MGGSTTLRRMAGACDWELDGWGWRHDSADDDAIRALPLRALSRKPASLVVRQARACQRRRRCLRRREAGERDVPSGQQQRPAQAPGCKLAVLDQEAALASASARCQSSAAQHHRTSNSALIHPAHHACSRRRHRQGCVTAPATLVQDRPRRAPQPPAAQSRPPRYRAALLGLLVHLSCCHTIPAQQTRIATSHAKDGARAEVTLSLPRDSQLKVSTSTRRRRPELWLRAR